MPALELLAPFAPAGDQPEAIRALNRGLVEGQREQILLGVTGSGKTFTIANVIAEQQRPTLVLSPNKTLAAQLWAEFREFFPKNAVEYFVSYYDFYQPEAYIPRTDTYIEKDSSRNDEIDRLRNSATRALLTRRDVVVVASISCIYGIGSPENYLGESITVKKGESWRRDILLRKLSDLQYARNDMDFGRTRFRVRGDVVDVQPAYEEIATRIEFMGDTIESIKDFDALTGEILTMRDELTVFPATHYVTPQEQLNRALVTIEAELEDRVKLLETRGRLLEAQRLRQRTNFDMEMMRETGHVRRHRELLAPPEQSRGRPAPALPARFPARRRAAHRRRVARRRSPDRRHEQGGPRSQDSPWWSMGFGCRRRSTTVP